MSKTKEQIRDEIQKELDNTQHYFDNCCTETNTEGGRIEKEMYRFKIFTLKNILIKFN